MRRIAAGVAVLAPALALTTACSSGGSDGESFTVALIEPDLTSVPLMEAIEIVREAGYDVDVVELAEPELAIEGLSKGQYAISAEATSPALVAIQQGAPIRIVADVIGNQWAVYAQDGLEACDDLVGKPVGIFSEGAVATAMVRQWVAEECSTGTPDYLVIGGSDIRAQALLQGQIDGTALEIADAVMLAETGSGNLNQLIDFAQALPDVHPQTVYANADFLDDNPEAAQAFIDALIEVHERINADPSYLVELAVTHLDSTADDVLQATAEEYVDRGLFDAAALTPENVQGTIDFFVGAGVIEQMSVEDVANLTFLPGGTTS